MIKTDVKKKSLPRRGNHWQQDGLNNLRSDYQCTFDLIFDLLRQERGGGNKIGRAGWVQMVGNVQEFL